MPGQFQDVLRWLHDMSFGDLDKNDDRGDVPGQFQDVLRSLPDMSFDDLDKNDDRGGGTGSVPGRAPFPD